MRYWKLLAAPMIGLGLLINVPAMGDQILLTPEITVRENYNDNIFFDTANVQRDFITIISPCLNFEKNTERLKAMLTARLDERLYADNNELNATDQFYLGNIRYALSPILNVGARAGYIVDSSPDRDLRTTGFVLNAAKRSRQEYGIFGDYDFTEKTKAELTYGYGKDEYDATQNAQLDNVETNSGSLLLTHDLSTYFDVTTGRLKVGYVDYRFTQSDVGNFTTMLGFNRRFTELWNLTVDAGVRYTESRFETGTFQSQDDSTEYGFVGNAVVSYRGEKTNLDFSLNHDIEPAGGQSGASERTGMGIRARRQFVYEFSGIFSGGYFMNYSSAGQYSSQKIDQQTLYLEPGIRYNFNRDMSIEAIYGYTRTEYNVEPSNAADQNLVMVRFNYKYPILE